MGGNKHSCVCAGFIRCLTAETVLWKLFYTYIYDDKTRDLFIKTIHQHSYGVLDFTLHTKKPRT